MKKETNKPFFMAESVYLSFGKTIALSNKTKHPYVNYFISMKKYTLLFLMVIGVVFSGCSKEDDVPGPEQGEIKRTILMYVIADTNISSSLKRGIDYFHQSLTPATIANNRLVVYWDGPAIGGRSNLPELFELTFDRNGERAEKKIMTYDQPVNSADADVFKTVLDKVMELYPSEDYGLIMSSHATGWLPATISYSRSIGDDNGQKMEIPDFANVIPDNTFNFMLFDVCHMACVEVAYELRNKTKYIVASPAETLVEGYPYHLMGTQLFKPEVDWKNVIDTYYDYYTAKSDVVLHSVAQSLIKTEKLGALASFSQNILEGNWETIKADPSYRQNTQYLDYFTAAGHHFIYDMGDFVERVQPAAYPDFTDLMAEVVPYYRHTDRITCNYATIQVNRYSGLGIYIPTTRYTAMNTYYQTYNWYSKVY